MKLSFVSSDAPDALAACNRLKQRYGDLSPASADVIVALGGDGFMLETLHRYLKRKKPIYGMNRGSVGFLMNKYRESGLPRRVATAVELDLHPLHMRAHQANGRVREALAINDVSMLRQTRQTAHLRMSVDDVERLERLVCDGILVATPAGSTAYNLSVYGPILPLTADVLAVTPISAFRPRRWRGAILPSHATIAIDVLEAEFRPVSAVADHVEVRNVTRVEVRSAPEVTVRLLFDPEHDLEERIVKEQFET
ncbi:MAG: NAD kinase [Alphaproteobacteria bacterium]